jgi:hypothetical protein
LLGAKLGGVLRVPAAVLLLVTLLFPAMLAWSAATFAAVAVGKRAARQRQSSV